MLQSSAKSLQHRGGQSANYHYHIFQVQGSHLFKSTHGTHETGSSCVCFLHLWCFIKSRDGPECIQWTGADLFSHVWDASEGNTICSPAPLKLPHLMCSSTSVSSWILLEIPGVSGGLVASSQQLSINTVLHVITFSRATFCLFISFPGVSTTSARTH